MWSNTMSGQRRKLAMELATANRIFSDALELARAAVPDVPAGASVREVVGALLLPALDAEYSAEREAKALEGSHWAKEAAKMPKHDGQYPPMPEEKAAMLGEFMKALKGETNG